MLNLNIIRKTLLFFITRQEVKFSGKKFEKIKEDAIVATFKDGVLELVVPE